MHDLTRATPASSPWNALAPSRTPRVAWLLGKVLALGLWLTGKDRYDDYQVERIRGVPFLVIPSVFNPKVPRTGEFLAAQISSELLGPDAEVLDMGTGSGVCAVFAARLARRVVATDINSEAVRCAGINVALNHLEHKIEVRQGDLFAPVSGERFDLVLFNPPFLCAAPRDDRDRAWRSVDVAERFARGLALHLKPAAVALVVLSSFGDARQFLEAFRRRGLAISVFAERRFVNEKLAVLRLTAPGTL
ncbi:MAG TPA: methyltransferase [Steroidobacteraceae bacterium]